jgi:rhamnosyltransferase
MKSKLQKPICVAVLLATHNGVRYLKEQLLSLENQSDVCTHLFVLDDGSNDGTIEILERCNSFPIDVKFQKMPLGPAVSFKTLLLNPDLIKFDYVAFCDQDDIWHKDKLKRAIKVMNENTEINLYSSKRFILKKQPLKLEKYPKRDLYLNPTSLLFENKCYGNTMVFKSKILLDIQETIKKSGTMPHDLLIARWALTKGKVFVDSKSFIEYRIHRNNHTGFGRRYRFLYLRIRRYPGQDSYFHNEYLEILEMNGSDETSEALLRLKNRKTGMDLKLESGLRMSRIEDWLFRLLLSFGYVPEIKRPVKYKIKSN